VLVRKYCLAEIIVNNLAKACGQADLIQISWYECNAHIKIAEEEQISGNGQGFSNRRPNEIISPGIINLGKLDWWVNPSKGGGTKPGA